jgi:hypothetical protein
LTGHRHDQFVPVHMPLATMITGCVLLDEAAEKAGHARVPGDKALPERCGGRKIRRDESGIARAPEINAGLKQINDVRE